MKILQLFSPATLKVTLMSSLLISAGLLHLVAPSIFYPAIPDFFIYKYEITILTGVLEIILGLLLLSSQLRNTVAAIIALYFILLLPIHIYVSWYEIEIFHISSPLLLWLRTVGQLPLIYWAIRLRE